MAILQRSKSAQAIRGEIEKVNADRDTMNKRLEEIEQAISDLWGNGTSKLESEYGAISVRLKASDRVLERLGNELKQAETNELFKALAEAQKLCGSVGRARNEAYERREKARKALEAADKELQQAEQQAQIANSREVSISRQLEQRGMSQNEINAILQQAIA